MSVLFNFFFKLNKQNFLHKFKFGVFAIMYPYLKRSASGPADLFHYLIPLVQSVFGFPSSLLRVLFVQDGEHEILLTKSTNFFVITVFLNNPVITDSVKEPSEFHLIYI